MAQTSRKTIVKKKTTSRAIPKKAPEVNGSTALAPATLKSFGKWETYHPGFAFTRYWWDGEGPRKGITPWIQKKLQPGDDPQFGQAAKAEILLPQTAPGDYADLDFLLKRFDETLPPFEHHAMIQVKLSLDPEEPWHVGYERVRSFARAHFAKRFPIVLVAHIPGVAGLDDNGSHVHCIVLSRPVTINGLGGACHRLCSDRGYEEALVAWQAWATAEEGAA